jgi:maleate cis-trans isomerase
MGRVGLIVPSSNTVVETDFIRELPDGVSLHTARMFLAEATAEAERAMVSEYLPRAVADIASVRPDVVAFACTSAGAVLGADGERRLISEIARETGAAVVSTNEAVGRWIERCLEGGEDVGPVGAVGPSRQPSPRGRGSLSPSDASEAGEPSPAPSPRGRGSRVEENRGSSSGRGSFSPTVAVITPYIDELNLAIRAGLEGRGLRVVRISGLGLTDNLDIGAVSPEEILELAERALTGLEFDVLFVSCTNFRGFEAREALSTRFGVPVVTSNQATFEAAMEAVGREPAYRR